MIDIKAAATSGLKYVQEWMKDSLGSSESFSGLRVTTKSALGYPPVWYAVNKISGHVGQLPLICKKRIDGGSEPSIYHPAYALLKRRPNRMQTAVAFKETITAHALLMGNGRAAIIRDDTGRPKELLLMLPDRTVTVLDNGEKWHATNIPKDDPLEKQAPEKIDRTYYKIPDTDVLHIPGLSVNGMDGLSLLDVAKETIGLGLAGQKSTARNFKNNARPGVIIEAPPGMFRTDEDAETFLENFNEAHAGLDDSGKAGLLREGMSIQTLPMNARDAEWLDQRKFERQDAALMFLLEQILGDDSSVSYNSLEQKNLAYLSNCLMRWLVKWEQECDEKLLGPRQKDRDSHFFKFNEKALLRADVKTQMITLTGYLKNKVYNPNEVRAKLDELPYEGGDEFLNPAITPNDSDIDSDGDSDSDEIGTATNIARRAVLGRLQHLVGVEIKRVNEAASVTKNFVSWLDQFYDGWRESFVSAVESIGGPSHLAEMHCDESKNELLELTEQVTQEQLAAAVAEITSNWQDRAELLTDSIIDEELIRETV